ncbi:MAG TPA: hypothetical protein VF026_15045 [Ktedonobacteraceae bacterium]
MELICALGCPQLRAPGDEHTQDDPDADEPEREGLAKDPQQQSSRRRSEGFTPVGNNAEGTVEASLHMKHHAPVGAHHPS